MVEEYSWGILGTTSTLEGLEGSPFGNPNSYATVDGTPYFYVSDLDQSMLDVKSDPRVSLSLSDAEALKSMACGTIPYGERPHDANIFFHFLPNPL